MKTPNQMHIGTTGTWPALISRVYVCKEISARHVPLVPETSTTDAETAG